MRLHGCVALLLVAGVFPCGAASLRASAVKVDITPQTTKWLAGYPARQSNGVHDHLYHRILALDDGHTQFFFVSTDLCLFTPSVYDEFAALLKKETGIGPLQVWWSVTHTHAAPEVGPHGLIKVLMPERYQHEPDAEYTAWVERKLVDGIKEARTKLEPARMAVGTGYAAANINRRGRDPNGAISLGLNPAGPVDRQIGLIRLERPDGTPIALVANYAMHGTALGPQNQQISGDAPGTVAAYVEEKIGAPMLYINGAAGNIAPIYTVQESFEAAHITEFNVLLGDRILAANRGMKAPLADVVLRAGERIVETLRRTDLHVPGESGPVRIPVRYLIMSDDVALWSAPVELFCEIAMDLRSHSPFQYTFYFGYTNGWMGYLPTKQAFAEGGYEKNTSTFTDHVEEDLRNTVSALLDGRGH